MRVRVIAGYGYPATVATAIVMQHAPYLGRAGYYINWDYGRPTETYESSGGWVMGSMNAPYDRWKATKHPGNAASCAALMPWGHGLKLVKSS